jgi:hypothetical protein
VPWYFDTNLVCSTEEEAESYAAIREAYLPDIILAYNGALTFSSEFTGPESLLKSLDLANIIAEDSNAQLADAFVVTGRMEDLVTSLALSSRQLLKINQGMTLTEKRAEKIALMDGRESKKAKRTLVRIKKFRAAGKGRGWSGENPEIWDPNNSGLAE